MKRILIIEDDRNIQELLRQELNDEGYSTSIASNGKEALSFLQNRENEKPDLIILDLRMPAMDGFETMGHILKLRHETPVVIHTAYPSYKDDALAMAADAFVVKSHDLTKLKSAIFELIGK
ncbi:MAG TPA: response regulator [Deltaproteobacteria bacterium]|nr:response regulator [Deltaproteobacteria bacterium]HQI80331.1 response regulator [Deltaproteobacteria bacterium]